MAIPLLSLLLMGGSIAANTIGANRQAAALNATQQAERMRQKGFDEEAFAINAQMRDRYGDAQGGTDAAASKLTDLYTAALDQPSTEPVAALPQSDSNLVVQSDATAAADARADAVDNARRLGAFRGFGDYFGGVSRAQGRDSASLGQIGSFRRGSQSVLPAELEAASGKGRNWMMLGDLLSAGSGLAATPGGFGKLGGLFGGGRGITVGSNLFGGNSWG